MKKMMYREAVAEALREEMARDEKIFIMGEDVAIIGGVYKATKGLLEEFGPSRVRNTPISEAAIASVATGAAMAGARPVAEIMHIDFFASCMDSIANQMAKMHYKTGGSITVPLVVRTQGGRSHSNSCTQSQMLESWVTHIPGLKVVMPATPYDVKGLLKASIRDNNPVIFIEHKGLYQTKGEVPEEDYIIPLGNADIKREGTDISIITYSKQVLTSLEATAELQKAGVSAEVIDLRTLVPLDFETISQSVKKTGRVIIVHEAIERAGFGAEITAQIQQELFDYLDAPIVRVAGYNTPVPFAPEAEIQSAPTVKRIIEAAKNIL